jgi:TetR/AcrR family transcriptional regulator, transcriptional repressor for nem operon
MVRIANPKRAIMDLAESFMQDMGFNGFSYADIAEEMGVTNATIHYHFPAKEDLAGAVIRRYRERFQLWTRNARVKDLSPVEKLEWFFSIYTNTRADNGKVCLAGSLETEFNSLPQTLREQTEALNRELLAWLEATLQEGRDKGEFQFNGPAAGKAALILSSLQGALQMARALGTEKFHEVVYQHKQDLNAFM